MKALSLDLTGERPALSLASYWLAEALVGEERFWVMSRGGFVSAPRMHFSPEPGATTDSIVFFGTPLDGIEFADRMKDAELPIHLAAIGVTPRTPPAFKEMFGAFASISALPETKRWLERAGVQGVLDLPCPWWGNHGKVSQAREVQLVDYHSGIFLRPPSNLPVKTRTLRWSTGGVPISPGAVIQTLADADVIVTSVSDYDDPVRAIATEMGIEVIQADTPKGIWRRIVEAARRRRDGVVQPAERGVAEEGCALVDIPEPSEVVLGVVVPFGGLPVEGLDRNLKRLRRVAPEGTPILVAHQSSDDEEASEVLKTCLRHSIGYARHESPEGWRLGLARNEGAEALVAACEGHDGAPVPTHVLFLDADIVVESGFFPMLLEEVKKYPRAIQVPYLRDGDGTTRIASGLATYPLGAFNVLDGFDETFAGWGYEDLELIRRMRKGLGVPSRLIGSPVDPMIRHVDHPPRWVDTRDGNLKKLEDLSRE